MKVKQLPPQLVSLVHHIALDQKGWWEKTIQRFIIASIWLSDKGHLQNIEITQYLKTNFGIKLTQNKIDEQILKLAGSHTLFHISKDSYKISEDEYKKFVADLEKYDEIERGSKDVFFTLLNTFCYIAEKEATWSSFNEELLAPLIHEMGARTYELISGHNTDIESHIKVQDYIKKFPKEIQLNIRNVIINFLNPKNAITREYVLRKLNAYFSLEAGNLSETAIANLAEATKKNLSFEVFIDTNFLFSILGLHEKEVNEAAESLLHLIETISNKIKIKLQVTPITLEETQDVLIYHQQILKNLRLPLNISSAASNTDISGLAKRFIEVCKDTQSVIKAEDYFSPYIKNLITIIKPKGLNFYNADLGEYTTDQRVVDDVLERLEYEEKIYGNKTGNTIAFQKENTAQKNNKNSNNRKTTASNKSKTPKTYEILLHDVMLWYFVKDKRPAMVESPADAINWIVTEDFRFLSFDSYKRKKLKNEKIPICIHPATLIQMLQFWEPRTVLFEEAILSNLRYPFLFHEFDKNSEKVTIKILETLSLYENVNILPIETVTSILMNDVLRGKIAKEESVEGQIKLISNLILETNSKTQGALSLAQEKISKKDEELFDKDNELFNKGNVIQSLKDKISRLVKGNEDFINEKNGLLARIELIENEQRQEKIFRESLEDFDQQQKTFISNHWNELPKHRAAIFWYFGLSTFTIAVFIVLYFTLDITNNYLKLYIPLLSLALTQILSFFNKDKIIMSFHYNFRNSKFRKKHETEFLKIFLQTNNKPTKVK